MTAKRYVVAVVCALLFATSAAAQCVSTLIPVSQPVGFPNHAASSIAWTGSLLGVAKFGADTPAKAIWFGVYDANFTQVRADVKVADTSLAGSRFLLWNGSEFALFYQAPNFQITLQRIDTNANPIGGPIAVAPAHPPTPGQEFDVAWDPTRKAYLVLRSVLSGFERGLWLTILGADGSQKSDDVVTFFTTDPVEPRVAVTPSGIVGILWSRFAIDGQQELVFATLVPGQPIASVTSVAKNTSNPLLATDGRLFFAVYTAPGTPGTTVLRSAKLDTAGRITTADALLLSGGTDVVGVSLIANTARSEWALLYVSYPIGVQSPQFGETRLRRIPFSGAVSTDSTLTSDSSKRTLAPRSALVWNGTAYVASVGQILSLAEGSESYLVRHCSFTVTVTATPAVTVPFAPVTFTTQVSSGVPPYMYSWLFGDLSSAAGPTVTHTYQHIGTYTVTVTVTDLNGSVVTGTVTVQIANLRHRAAQH